MPSLRHSWHPVLALLAAAADPTLAGFAGTDLLLPMVGR